MGLESNRHLRIIDPAAGDEFISRRLDAIGRLKTRIRKKALLRDQLTFASNLISALVDQHLDESIRHFTAESLAAAAPSFVDDGTRNNELSIVFALSCGEATNVAMGAASEAQMEFLARAVKLGLSYLAPLKSEPREALRRELITLTGGKLNSSAEDERQRGVTPTQITAENSASATSTLARNARWDREELDLLWWVVNDWSTIADRRVSAMMPEVACVISAIETSGLFAGPAARGHRNIATRHVADPAKSRTPAEFATGSAEARPWARHALAPGLSDIEAYRSIVPGMAIATLADDESSKGLRGAPAAGAEASLANWCRRLVDEIDLLKRLGHAVSLQPFV